MAAGGPTDAGVITKPKVTMASAGAIMGETATAVHLRGKRKPTNEVGRRPVAPRAMGGRAGDTKPIFSLSEICIIPPGSRTALGVLIVPSFGRSAAAAVAILDSGDLNNVARERKGVSND